MKYALLPLVSLLLPGALALCPASTVSFPDVPAAKEQAREANQPALILWYGSDWMPDAAALCKEWESFSRTGLPVVFGQFDERLGLKGDRNKVLPVEHYNLPAVVLLAPDGTFMAEYTGADVKHPKKLEASLRKLLPKAAEFVKLAAQARQTPGVEGARAAGQALSLVPVKDATRNTELTRLIHEKDPQDTTGYRSLFALEHMGMYKEINMLLQGGADGKLKGAERDFAAAERYVRAALGHKMLKGERLQQWMSGLAYIQKEKLLSSPDWQKEGKKRKSLADAYKAIARIDPKSQYGKGAARLARYWDPQSFYTIKDHFYNSGDQTHNFDKDWHIDVTQSINGKGDYIFSLIPMDNGPMETRHFRLVANGKEIAKAKIDPAANTKTVEFAVPALPKGTKVEVWLTAKCYDGWFGCQGFVEMKKKE